MIIISINGQNKQLAKTNLPRKNVNKNHKTPIFIKTHEYLFKHMKEKLVKDFLPVSDAIILQY